MANMVDWGGQRAPFWKTHIKDNYTKAHVPNSLLEERVIISCRLVRVFFVCCSFEGKSSTNHARLRTCTKKLTGHEDWDFALAWKHARSCLNVQRTLLKHSGPCSISSSSAGKPSLLRDAGN